MVKVDSSSPMPETIASFESFERPARFRPPSVWGDGAFPLLSGCKTLRSFKPAELAAVVLDRDGNLYVADRGTTPSGRSV